MLIITPQITITIVHVKSVMEVSIAISHSTLVPISIVQMEVHAFLRFYLIIVLARLDFLD